MPHKYRSAQCIQFSYVYVYILLAFANIQSIILLQCMFMFIMDRIQQQQLQPHQ